MGGKVKEQNEARKLRRSGRSLNEIARQLSVSKSSVSIWVRKIRLKPKHVKRLRQRELDGGNKGRRRALVHWREYRKLHPKPIPKGPPPSKRSVVSFFDTWTPQMAYVLGYFAADGCMYQNKRGSHYIAFYSTDLELIEMVRDIMNVTNRIESHDPRNDESYGQKIKYTLQIGSIKLFQKLTKLGFTPNKSLKLQFPKMTSRMLAHFTRGYLDGDGCVSFRVYDRKNRPNPASVLSVQFTCGNRPFLISLHDRLKKAAHLKGGSIRNQTRSCGLYYSTNDSRQLYKFMYPSPTVPCLQRKKDTFERAFKKLDKIVVP